MPITFTLRRNEWGEYNVKEKITIVLNLMYHVISMENRRSNIFRDYLVYLENLKTEQ